MSPTVDVLDGLIDLFFDRGGGGSETATIYTRVNERSWLENGPLEKMYFHVFPIENK